MFTVLLTGCDVINLLLETAALGDMVALPTCIFYCPDCPGAHEMGNGLHTVW